MAKDNWKDDPNYQNLAHGVDDRGLTAEQDAEEHRKIASRSQKEAARDQRQAAKEAKAEDSKEAGS